MKFFVCIFLILNFDNALAAEFPKFQNPLLDVYERGTLVRSYAQKTEIISVIPAYESESFKLSQISQITDAKEQSYIVSFKGRFMISPEVFKNPDEKGNEIRMYDNWFIAKPILIEQYCSIKPKAMNYVLAAGEADNSTVILEILNYRPDKVNVLYVNYALLVYNHPDVKKTGWAKVNCPIN